VTAELHREWIVSDIGYTHVRLKRWFTQRSLSDNAPARYRNDDLGELGALINRYRGDAADQ
jgi:hypothetical protein